MSKVNKATSISEPSDIAPFLITVSKPTRYLGNEVNAIYADITTKDVKVVLAFPDVYEIGMSHLGLKIIYEIINEISWACAERVYAPWFDMENVIRKENISLFSLESKIPLAGFDIIGFSLQYEMSYTNVLNMLELGKIPLLSSDRTDKDPLIIAGGPCVFNPEPLSDFIDIFCIGDGEELIVELLQIYRTNKEKSRKEILEALSRIQGVYVPAFYEVSYNTDGTIKEVRNQGLEIKRRVIQNLDTAKFPTMQIVPFMEIVHDRATLEIQRGCTQGCRFCQAGMVYRPVRQRSLETLVKQGKEVISQTGYEEISLCSLSSTDYSAILSLVSSLNNSFSGKVSISLPSLRVDSLVPELYRLISKISHTGLTLAPEAGSERLRKVINKNISQQQLIDACEHAYQLGWKQIKLYFMIGLPTETDEDLEALIELVKQIKRTLKGKTQIKVSISSFVPKSHTPFQWQPQVSIEEIKRRQDFIKARLPHKGTTFSWHEVRLSLLEAVFSRGDRRLGKVLFQAFKLGCRFDAWTEHFRFDLWMEAFSQCQISPEFYANRNRDVTEILPWDHIDIGITKEFLIQENKKAYEESFTPDCRQGGCSNCGLKCSKIDYESQNERQESQVSYSKPVKDLTVRNIRVRIKFTKRKEIIFISHLDTIRLFNRAIRRAGIPVTMSEGFHPHQRVSFGHPLSVGIKSQAEFVDIDLVYPMKLEDLQFKLNQVLPPGIEITTAFFISTSAKSLSVSANLLHYHITTDTVRKKEWWQDKIKRFLDSDEIWIKRVRKGVVTEIEIRQWVKEIEVTSCKAETASGSTSGLEIDMYLRVTEKGTVNPKEVILWFDPDIHIMEIERMEQFAHDGGVLIG